MDPSGVDPGDLGAFPFLQFDGGGNVLGWDKYMATDCLPDDPRLPIISALVQFFTENQKTYFADTDDIASNGLVQLDYRSLEAEIPVTEFSTVLKDEPSTVLACLEIAVHHAILRLVDDPKIFVAERVYVRLENYGPETHMRHLKSNFIDKFVCLSGTVVRVSNIKPLVTGMAFTCGKCGIIIFRHFTDGRYEPPTGCEGKCRSRSFTPDRAHARAIDWQRIKLQEIVHSGQGEQGRIPRTIEVELKDDLVDGCIPGDVISVCGVVKARKSSMSAGGGGGRNRQKSLFVLFVDANCIENGNKNQNGKLDVFQFTHRDYKAIQSIHSEPQTFKLLVHSLCPSIYGHEVVKAGLLLSLFGGAKHHMDDPRKLPVRGDVHVLIVGDPGLGKSQLLRAASNLAPRGVYVCGNTASSSGLTVTMVREGKGGDFALEAGALVLADQGTCCIDEFDKMSSDHNSLLEAMEQQSISIAKAGIVCSLAARTAIIAAANPIGGHYNRCKTVSENLKIGTPLLSRFDVIFILLDKPDAERDQLLSEHVLQLHSGDARPKLSGSSVSSTQDMHDVGIEAWEEWNQQKPLGARLRLSAKQLRSLEVIPHTLLRKYIAYARKFCHPRLTQGAKNVLTEFYLKLRAEHASHDSTPITTRQIESMVRMSEARARSELRETVTEQDARDVIDVMRESLYDVFVDGDLGHVDFRKAGGISKNKQIKLFMKAVNKHCKTHRVNVLPHDALYKLAKDMNLGVENFDFFIDTLNNQNYLLNKGSRQYQIMTVDSA